ncbi:hypothetical protein J4Q44_G00345270 [Coregonus suidteri]|uniref:Uncharacterized protein n=1 Tax=Coregonus suidteri TaxID=861788 RepID=A0AAN8KZ28_9TELE
MESGALTFAEKRISIYPDLSAELPKQRVTYNEVVEDCYDIMEECGFRFVRRGPIFVKGKGELLSFFMKGEDKPTL